MELDYFDLIFSIIFSIVIWHEYKEYFAPILDRYHTFWPRFWAPTIDELVLWVPTSLFPFLIIKTFDFNTNSILLITNIFFFLYYLYSIYCHGTYGATIGKMTTKVKVVDAFTEGPITMQQAILRDIIPVGFSVILIIYEFIYSSGNDSADTVYSYNLALILVVWFVAEIVTMLTNPKRRALHDFIAGTVVIRTNIE